MPAEPLRIRRLHLAAPKPRAGTADIARHVRRLQNVKALRQKPLGTAGRVLPALPCRPGIGPSLKGEELFSLPEQRRQAFFLRGSVVEPY